MRSPNSMFDAFSDEDLREIFPPGLVSGVTLWIRAGMPKSNADIMQVARNQPPKGSHPRAGWFMCLAVLLESMKVKGTRVFTAKMRALHDRLKCYLHEFMALVHDRSTPRRDLLCKKNGAPFTVQVILPMINNELETWLATPWPSTSSTMTDA